MYIDKLDDIVDEYNNTYHRTIKMKPVDVKDNTYIDFEKKLMIKILNLKLVIMFEFLNTKNIFAKGYASNCSEKVFVIIKIKNEVLWTYVVNDLKSAEIIAIFYEKELRKTNQKKFRIEKVIKRKGDKLYVKWRGYDNSCNSWIDKKDLV